MSDQRMIIELAMIHMRPNPKTTNDPCFHQASCHLVPWWRCKSAARRARRAQCEHQQVPIDAAKNRGSMDHISKQKRFDGILTLRLQTAEDLKPRRVNGRLPLSLWRLWFLIEIGL